MSQTTETFDLNDENEVLGIEIEHRPGEDQGVVRIGHLSLKMSHKHLGSLKDDLVEYLNWIDGK